MVAEKTSIAHTLASVFGGSSVERRSGLSPRSSVFEYGGTFQGEQAHFRVTSTQGHVYSMDFGDEYSKPGKHSAEELFSCPVVKLFDKDARLPEHLAAEGAGCHVLVLWLDCDREGENICFEVVQNVEPVLDKSKTFPGAYRDRIFRARFSSLCKADLQQAMNKLGVPSEDEASSVDARMEIDLRLGIAFSRFQTQYFRQNLGSRMRDLIKTVTYGPCQMPTLWFCVHRHCQIQAFVPKSFWRLRVNLSIDGKEFRAEAACGEMWSKHEAELLLRKVCADEYAKVSAIDQRRVTQQRPQPLNTVTMLQMASKVAALSPGDAMHHAEQLYLKGFLSYPRTETARYPQEFDAGAAIEMFQAPESPWAKLARRLSAARTAPRVDGADHGDHPPIIPIQLATEAQCKEAGAWSLYQLVCLHFLATFSPDCIIMETEVKFALGGAPLTAKSSRRTPGEFTWCDVLDSDSPEPCQAELEHLQVGSKCLAGDPEILEQATQPPLHLNESDLLGLMEKHAIGTDASMATHISNVLKRNYVKLDAKTRQLTPTGLGLALAHAYTLVDPGLVRPTVRAKIENACARVAKGQARRQEVVDQAVQVFRQKFQNFCRRIDRVPVMLAMAYASDQDRTRALNASVQWDFAARETASIKLEYLLLVRGCQELDDDDKGNSELRPGVFVRLDGLTSAPHLNGRLGICGHLDSSTGRWHIQLPSGETKALKKDNLQGIAARQLSPGLPVRVHGLEKAPQLNGQEGVCKQWDATGGRWQVSLQSGELKSLKLENLQEITDGEVAKRAATDAKQELEALGLAGTDHVDQNANEKWEDEMATKWDWEGAPRRSTDTWEKDTSAKRSKAVTPPRSRANDAWENEPQAKRPKSFAPPGSRSTEGEQSAKRPKVVLPPRAGEKRDKETAHWSGIVLPPGAAQTSDNAPHASQTASAPHSSEAPGLTGQEKEPASTWSKVIPPPRAAQTSAQEAHSPQPTVVLPPSQKQADWQSQQPAVVLPPSQKHADWERPHRRKTPKKAKGDKGKGDKWTPSCPTVVLPPGAKQMQENEQVSKAPTVVLPPRATPLSAEESKPRATSMAAEAAKLEAENAKLKQQLADAERRAAEAAAAAAAEATPTFNQAGQEWTREDQGNDQSNSWHKQDDRWSKSRKDDGWSKSKRDSGWDKSQNHDSWSSKGDNWKKSGDKSSWKNQGGNNNNKNWDRSWEKDTKRKEAWDENDRWPAKESGSARSWKENGRSSDDGWKEGGGWKERSGSSASSWKGGDWAGRNDDPGDARGRGSDDDKWGTPMHRRPEAERSEATNTPGELARHDVKESDSGQRIAPSSSQYRWTASGVELVAELGLSEEFGNPRPGDDTTEEQTEMLAVGGISVAQAIEAGAIEGRQVQPPDKAPNDAPAFCMPPPPPPPPTATSTVAPTDTLTPPTAAPALEVFRWTETGITVLASVGIVEMMGNPRAGEEVGAVQKQGLEAQQQWEAFVSGGLVEKV